MFEKTTLRLVRRRHKIRRKVRDIVRAISHAANPISDEYDRAPLLRDALPQAIAQDPSHPGVEGEIAVFSTYCGKTRTFTFDRNNRAQKYPHYFVSNNRRCLQIAEHFGWHPIYLDLPILPNSVASSQQSKIAKSLPHLFPDLRKHRFLVYSDDKQRIHHKDIQGHIDQLTQANGAIAMKLSPHISDNILWEFTDSLMQDRYRVQAHRMLRFVIDQLEDGKTLPTERMFMTGYSVRDLEHPQTIALSEEWYDDVLACGIDCQLAFDFLAQGNAQIVDLPAPTRKKYLGTKI